MPQPDFRIFLSAVTSAAPATPWRRICGRAG
jgi:hypothetical protein